MANSCETCKHYEVGAYDEPCVSCRFRDYDVPTKWENPFNQKTNADRIRAMSDEELAELVGKYVYCGLCPLQHRCVAGECSKVVMEWLKQPAEE